MPLLLALETDVILGLLLTTTLVFLAIKSPVLLGWEQCLQVRFEDSKESNLF